MRSSTAAAVSSAILAIVVLAPARAARADRFIPIGARERAIGGAGVAASEDAISIYWNPANLALTPLGRDPYPAEVEEALEARIGRARGVTETSAIKDLPYDRWIGYDQFQVLIAANVDVKLTGDIVRRLDEIDELIEKSDVEGAIDRAETTPPSLTEQDFRNIVKFYEQVENLDEGGDAVFEAGGGLFVRYRSFGLGIYTNSYLGIRPTVSLAQNAGVGNTNDIDQIANQVETSAGQYIAPTPGSAAEAFSQELQTQFGLNQNTAEVIAGTAEAAGVNLNDPDLRSALGIAATQTGAAGGSIEDNPSGATATAISTQEVALSFALESGALGLAEELFSVGVAAKLMHGITAQQSVKISEVIDNDKDFNDTLDEALKNREESFNFGIDLGASLQPVRWLRVSLVGRNLNQPKFDLKGGGHLRLKQQWRAGLAVRPVESLLLTVEGDIKRNEAEALPGFHSRYIGAGLEWNPDVALAGFALRLGAFTDLEDKDRVGEHRPVITAGLGLKAGVVVFDLGASVGLETEEFRDQKIPSDLGAALTLGVSW